MKFVVFIFFLFQLLKEIQMYSEKKTETKCRIEFEECNANPMVKFWTKCCEGLNCKKNNKGVKKCVSDATIERVSKRINGCRVDPYYDCENQINENCLCYCPSIHQKCGVCKSGECTNCGRSCQY
jgi:hypothetical protein